MRCNNPIDFWKFVDIPTTADSCWLYKGRCNGKGYGAFSIKGKLIQAHRFSYLYFYNNIPNKLHVLHNCDVRNCVNPLHLWLGTNSENVADKVRKGRQYRGGAPKGAENGQSKITKDIVFKIRADNRSYSKIAKDHNISASQVGAIKRRTYWGHI